jgi:hypothetical protein
MRALGAIANALTAVANAVQTAARIFFAALNWLKNAILGIFHAVMDPIINTITDAYKAWINNLAQLVLQWSTISLGEFVERLFQIAFFSVFAL